MIEHDGPLLQRADHVRLNAQQQGVFDLMRDGNWRTIGRIAKALMQPEPSISARLRDLRKPKFGGHTVERRYIANGLYEYRLAA